ncbi:SAM-dependent methyltransferase [Shewanella frigidimarina]|uniref:SAM-dependent methyltransferase n=1 Tax=Shewanella frigidimarina TaxID=56812 RepID=UPI000F4E52A3|nr:SAM-dependent methyltransferase [Shewanella frigidimarina]RPA60318.1 SAM-dependent methyltransferase [Shewanella frigidimarina]
MTEKLKKVEFGDFQTPLALSSNVISSLGDINSYELIIEPTCGLGSFLISLAQQSIPHEKLEGWEINPIYTEEANKRINKLFEQDVNLVKQQDFFEIEWDKGKFNGKTLFIGNPPWVTNSELGKLSSQNLPEKANFHGLKGLEAMTGKSNFDISEWMLIKLLEIISGSDSGIAFLIKTSVARKLIQFIDKNNLSINNISIKEIDAKKHFDVSVDACLFQASGCDFQQNGVRCEVYNAQNWNEPYKIMGVVDSRLVSNINDYINLCHIDKGSEFKWRSGVKHDASKVMELTLHGDKLENGNKEKVNIERDFVYPMYKSSNLAKEILPPPVKFMIVTQKKIGDETNHISTIAPLTWQYLIENSEKLDGRKSSIYKNSPRFSIFGVGDYTFKPYKVAISGMYKNFSFAKVGLFNDKAIVLDDTCYMLGFETKEEANLVYTLLSSEVCKKFINSIVFTDNKRPITVALLNRINLKEIAIEAGLDHEYVNTFNFE